MAYECTEERFLHDVRDHQVTIIRDDGVHRHIRLKRPSTICYYFDLITWPGHLCITGDCGTYVFQRLEDMFEFFRMDRKPREGALAINPMYWGEKLQAIARNGGYEEHSEAKFRSVIKEYFDSHFADEAADDKLTLEDPECDPDETKRAAERTTKRTELWEEIENSVLCYADDQYRGPSAAYDFEHEGFSFQDFFEYRLTDYTFHFIWNLYAIVWGISKYDLVKAQSLEAK